MEKTNVAADRQAAILEAAMGVFSRYGFKKTSMDDLARAAGLSRQGLYLHFENKQAVFKAMAMGMAARMRADAREALVRDDLEVEERILGAFDVMFGKTAGAENLDELFATMLELVGRSTVFDIEDELASDVARVLHAAGIGARKGAEDSAKRLADLLFAASDGIKRRATTPAEYHDRMRVAVRLVCRDSTKPAR